MVLIILSVYFMSKKHDNANHKTDHYNFVMYNCSKNLKFGKNLRNGEHKLQFVVEQNNQIYLVKEAIKVDTNEKINLDICSDKFGKLVVKKGNNVLAFDINNTSKMWEKIPKLPQESSFHSLVYYYEKNKTTRIGLLLTRITTDDNSNKINLRQQPMAIAKNENKKLLGSQKFVSTLKIPKSINGKPYYAKFKLENDKFCLTFPESFAKELEGKEVLMVFKFKKNRVSIETQTAKNVTGEGYFNIDDLAKGYLCSEEKTDRKDKRYYRQLFTVKVANKKDPNDYRIFKCSVDFFQKK